MDTLLLVQLLTIVISIIFVIASFRRLAYQMTNSNLIADNKWKKQLIPFFFLIAFLLFSQLSTKAGLTLAAILLIVFLFLPINLYLVPLESFFIRRYRPRIVHQSSCLTGSLTKNNWDSVKFIGVHSVLTQLRKNDVSYIGWIFIPALHLKVPLADYTNDAVYQCGAGMLHPQLLQTPSHLVIGAHNLGRHSQALFSLLARNQLYLQGLKVIIASLDWVKEFRIFAVQITDSTNVSAAMMGASNTLTLVTCTDNQDRRFLVHAHVTAEYPFENAGIKIRQFFNRE